MDDGCRAIRGTMTSTEESDRHKIMAFERVGTSAG